MGFGRNWPDGLFGESKQMKLKLADDGNAVVIDGKPVYVHDDGKEAPFDVAGTVQTISRLNAEAKSHRERAEAAEKSLKPFEGITDPVAAIKALEIVSNLDHKKLVDAGEVEKVKAEISKAFETKLSESNGKVQTLEQQLYSEKIGGNFSRSKLIAEKLAIPADLVQAKFGQAFKVENGQIVAYDHTGNKIFSRSRPGELADFDESLEALIENYPHKDSILKGSSASGGGASNNPSAGSSGSKTIQREVYLTKSPAEQASLIKSGILPVD